MLFSNIVFTSPQHVNNVYYLVLGRFCIPDPLYTNSTKPATIVINGTTYQQVTPTPQENAQSLINFNIINTDKLMTYISDLVTTWPILLASLGFSFIVALLYLVFVRLCASIIAYCAIVLVLAGLAGLGYVFQSRIDYYQNLNETTYQQAMLALCIICYVFAGLWLLMILFMCNRIRLAIALTQCTAKYLCQVCSVFFVPFFFYFISAIFYAYWIVLAVYLYSTGTVTYGSSFIPNVAWTSTTRYAFWYHLFALFYIGAFINAYNQFVIASTTCIWYFEHLLPDGAEHPVYRSFFRGGRYHLGSLAFGALIIAIIRFMMAVLEYFKQQIEKAAPASTAGIYKCALTCCQCCLECFARVMEFINRHAYIQVNL